MKTDDTQHRGSAFGADADVPHALLNAPHMQRQAYSQSIPRPAIDARTVEYLEKMFPPQHPTVEVTMAQVQREAGQRDVVMYLRSLLNEQEES